MRVQPLSLLLLCSTYFYSVSFSLQEAAAHNLVPDSDFVGADNTAKYNWHGENITYNVSSSPINYSDAVFATLSIADNNIAYVPRLSYSKTGDLSIETISAATARKEYTFSYPCLTNFSKISGTNGTLSATQTYVKNGGISATFDLYYRDNTIDIENFRQEKLIVENSEHAEYENYLGGPRPEMGIFIENLGDLGIISGTYVSNGKILTAYDEDNTETGMVMTENMFAGAIYNQGTIAHIWLNHIHDSKAEMKYYLRTDKNTMGFNGDTSNYAEFGAIANSGTIYWIEFLHASGNEVHNYGYAHAAGGGIVNKGYIGYLRKAFIDDNKALSINFKAYGSVYNKGSFFLYTFYPRPA